MRTLLVSFFALIISFGMLVPEAEAKRFGGGFNLGKSFSSPKRVQPAAPLKTASSTPPVEPTKLDSRAVVVLVV